MESSNSCVSHDPRDRLVREKYFSLRPKPLERYLWQQGLPQAAERVFWLHWETGMRQGDWCSEIPLKRVAVECCIDPSTVTRAYQLLKAKGLIRRESAGRDPDNPFQQATAITEVRIPKELLTELGRSPNRGNVRRLQPASLPEGPREPSALGIASAPVPAAAASDATPATPRISRQDMAALWGRASATERGRYFTASRSGMGHMDFDGDTRLSAEDRGQLLTMLDQMAQVHHTKPPVQVSPARSTATATTPLPKSRRLSLLELARTRKRVQETVPQAQCSEVLRQVVWAVEEGALRRFDLPLAVNIAVKKIREGAWTRPNRMPPNWARLAALPETCTAA